MEQSTPRSPLSVVVLTLNEERNLEECLASTSPWTTEVFVVDSGSTDATVEIANRFGARVMTHPFEGHEKQWNWALRSLPIHSEWVLALDADQSLTPELQREIAQRLATADAPRIDGFFLNRRQIFRGKWIRHGGYYPKYLLKLFRKGSMQLGEGDLVDHHFRVEGRTESLSSDLIECNRNEDAIGFWLSKHLKYAELQAREEWELRGRRGREGRFWGSPDERILWAKRLWRALPLYLRPTLYFIYRYFFRLGFLDGRQGFAFHALQGFWYRLIVDIHLEDLRGKGP